MASSKICCLQLCKLIPHTSLAQASRQSVTSPPYRPHTDRHIQTHTHTHGVTHTQAQTGTNTRRETHEQSTHTHTTRTDARTHGQTHRQEQGSHTDRRRMGRAENTVIPCFVSYIVFTLLEYSRPKSPKLYIQTRTPLPSSSPISNSWLCLRSPAPTSAGSRALHLRWWCGGRLLLLLLDRIGRKVPVKGAWSCITPIARPEWHTACQDRT